MPIASHFHDSEHGEVRIFQVHESVEVYDGSLALAVDHLMNHIKALISSAYLPADKNLVRAMQKHPLLRKGSAEIRSHERVLLADCIRLLDALVEISHLAAYPETSAQAAKELEDLRKDVPFLDYRYENDPYPSDADRE
ncbi:MAG: hypothetical protein CVU39_01680 [Chloroflexi bacterium HGW-Chloroflexi-10]|nr:MAG: hypothetical protein CVU39_01680 [Chloroflexi bacterium HGW-Chloroflexi-10]